MNRRPQTIHTILCRDTSNGHSVMYEMRYTLDEMDEVFSRYDAAILARGEKLIRTHRAGSMEYIDGTAVAMKMMEAK